VSSQTKKKKILKMTKGKNTTRMKMV